MENDTKTTPVSNRNRRGAARVLLSTIIGAGAIGTAGTAGYIAGHNTDSSHHQTDSVDFCAVIKTALDKGKTAISIEVGQRPLDLDFLTIGDPQYLAKKLGITLSGDPLQELCKVRYIFASKEGERRYEQTIVTGNAYATHDILQTISGAAQNCYRQGSRLLIVNDSTPSINMLERTIKNSAEAHKKLLEGAPQEQPPDRNVEARNANRLSDAIKRLRLENQFGLHTPSDNQRSI